MISRAEPPAEPAFPKLPVIIPIVIVASCLFAALLAVLLESMDHGFSTPDQVEQALGIPAIGVMPSLRRRFRRATAPETWVTRHPNSSFGETLRALNTSLALSSLDRAPKVVMVASALPGEGKSSTVLSWARMMAGDGKRVVVVDCDLRRGRLHRACGVTREPGLSDLLTGKANLAEVIHRDSFSSAFVISTGKADQMAPDLIGSDAMRKALAALSECFDLVMLDTAPLLLASETRSLCRLADKTVLVVRWQDTTRLDVAAGLRLLLAAGANMAGCVLSMVDADRYAKYASRSPYGRQGRALPQQMIPDMAAKQGGLQPMRVALLMNFVAPYRVPLFERLRDMVGELRILISTPMESDRAWVPDWGNLDVVVQRNVTLRPSKVDALGFRRKLHVHVPYDTLPQLLRYRPDCVVSVELGPRTLQALAYKMLRPRTPLLVWCKLSEHSERGWGRVRTLARSAIFRWADGVLVNGESGARYVRRFGVPDGSIVRINQPVDVARFAAARRTRPDGAGERLLHVGMLNGRKGVVPFAERLIGWGQAQPVAHAGDVVAGRRRGAGQPGGHGVAGQPASVVPGQPAL